MANVQRDDSKRCTRTSENVVKKDFVKSKSGGSARGTLRCAGKKMTHEIGLERDTLSWVWLWSENRAIRSTWCPARGHKLNPLSPLEGPVGTQLNKNFVYC
jgi:hypothetical protein